MTTDTSQIAVESCTGFIAGTLIHSQGGLIPIEEIEVGDLVLSRAEDGQGTPQYRPVARTFVRPGQSILRVAYTLPSELNREFVLTSTRVHPFWSEERGWTRAVMLEGDYSGPSLLRLRDDSLVEVGSVTPVYRTDQPGVGWIGPAARESDGALWDYNAKRLVKGGGVPYGWDVWDRPMPGIADSDDPTLHTTVYTIEIAEFHTYFVGRHGVWVHDVDCSG